MEEHLLQEPENDRPGRDAIIIFAVFLEAGMAPFSIFLGWLIGHPPLHEFVWNLTDALWGAAAAVPLIVVFLTMLIWPIRLFARVRRFCEEVVVQLLDQSTWSELALISLSAGVGEEMLFRGVFQAWFTQWLGLSWGLVLASALFGLLHPVSLAYMAFEAALGFYFGAVWYINGNLLAVMVTHTLFDFAALSYLIRFQHWDDRQRETD